MIISKIKKHFSITLVRLNQRKELKKMLTEKNMTLNTIVESFLELQSNKKSINDLRLFKECENYRTLLLEDKTLISYELFGSNSKQTVSQICKKATSSSIWGQFLFLIIKKTHTPHVLEIGTNLGVSGAYILSALRNKDRTSFVTMEGLPMLCEIANKHFKSMETGVRYEIVEGLYENTFSKILNKKTKFNIAFLDGNHKKEATLMYFEHLKSIMGTPSIMIFDDINWSPGMKEVWNTVIKDNNVAYSINLFKLGIIILDQEANQLTKNFRLHLSY